MKPVLCQILNLFTPRGIQERVAICRPEAAPVDPKRAAAVVDLGVQRQIRLGVFALAQVTSINMPALEALVTTILAGSLPDLSRAVRTDMIAKLTQVLADAQAHDPKIQTLLLKKHA